MVKVDQQIASIVDVWSGKSDGHGILGQVEVHVPIVDGAACGAVVNAREGRRRCLAERYRPGADTVITGVTAVGGIGVDIEYHLSDLPSNHSRQVGGWINHLVVLVCVGPVAIERNILAVVRTVGHSDISTFRNGFTPLQPHLHTSLIILFGSTIRTVGGVGVIAVAVPRQGLVVATGGGVECVIVTVVVVTIVVHDNHQVARAVIVVGRGELELIPPL